MPVLADPKHEAFAQELAADKTVAAAGAAVGLRMNTTAVARLAAKVAPRVAEIRTGDAQTAADRLAISEERVLRELARIAFADIRKIVDWTSELAADEEPTEAGSGRAARKTAHNPVRLKSASCIDDDIAGAIAEIRHSSTGGLTVKLHPKLPALDALADHLGISKPQRAAASDPPAEPVEISEHEAARRVAFVLRRARQASAAGETPED